MRTSDKVLVTFLLVLGFGPALTALMDMWLNLMFNYTVFDWPESRQVGTVAWTVGAVILAGVLG